jgi:hypothetical protein
MGYYIQGDGPHHKAEFIIDKYAGQLMLDPVFLDPAKGFVTVCVVNNGPFEAAAVAYSQEEFDAFNDPTDYRPKVWLKVPTNQAVLACPDVKDQLMP